MQISSQQLAELLIGIARAQIAIAQGDETPPRNPPSLVDLPLKIVLDTLRRSQPDVTAVTKELERLCAREPGSPGKDLDFGAPPP